MLYALNIGFFFFLSYISRRPLTLLLMCLGGSFGSCSVRVGGNESPGGGICLRRTDRWEGTILRLSHESGLQKLFISFLCDLLCYYFIIYMKIKILKNAISLIVLKLYLVFLKVKTWYMSPPLHYGGWKTGNALKET